MLSKATSVNIVFFIIDCLFNSAKVTISFDIIILFFIFHTFFNNGVVSCLSFAPLDTNWRLHSVGLTLLIDKYVDAKVVNKKALVNSHHAIDTDRNG